MDKFRVIDNDAVFKQAPNEGECLPMGHLARFVHGGVVKQMDLSAFESGYVGLWVASPTSLLKANRAVCFV